MAVRAALLCVVLAGCGSGAGQAEQTRILKAAFDGIFPGRGGGGEASSTAPPPPLITRAQIEEAGVAMLRARLVEENATALYSAAAENGGFVSYVSRFSQMLTLRGVRITANRGMGFDLLATAVAGDDPLVQPRPLAAWPDRVSRSYQYPGDGPAGDRLLVKCGFEIGERREIEIVEVTYSGVQVEERCEGDGLTFSNFHFVEPATGSIWRSIQWLGPQQGAIDIEILARS